MGTNSTLGKSATNSTLTGAPFAGATGALVEHVPPGAARDELMLLVRLGIPFAKRHLMGKQCEFLHNYIVEIVKNMKGRPTYENLLDELMLAADRRNESDGRQEPVESLSRSYELLTYHHPRDGRQQVTFGTVRNRLTAAKKELNIK